MRSFEKTGASCAGGAANGGGADGGPRCVIRLYV